jgi:hypothetical protein
MIVMYGHRLQKSAGVVSPGARQGVTRIQVPYLLYYSARILYIRDTIFFIDAGFYR